MGVLQRFERRLEGMVGLAFARIFKGKVHPAEIAQALQREAVTVTFSEAVPAEETEG